MAPAGGTRGWTSAARRQAVFEIIDGLLEEFPIDRQRIYLMGFSLGGGGIWNICSSGPVSSPPPTRRRPPEGLDPELVKNTPIWATIGINDSTNRLEQLTSRCGADSRGQRRSAAGPRRRKRA